jgi:hypothetical protein
MKNSSESSWILSSLVLLIISCSSKNNWSEGSYELKSIGQQLIVHLDDESSNLSMGLFYFQGEREFLFDINWSTNDLLMYELQTGGLEKRIHFEIEGDQGVGQLFGFHVHRLDSIFLFSQFGPDLILTDTSGLVKNRIKYQVPDLYSAAFVHNSYFLSPPILKGDELFVKVHFQGNYREVTQEQLAGYGMVYAINLKTGAVRFPGQNYPSDYLEAGLKHFEPSMASDGKKVVYSLFGDHRLFFAPSFDAPLQSVNTPSKHLDQSMPLFPIHGERFDTQKYLLGSSRYETILYDPYREVYYRFAFPTYTFQSDEEVRSLRAEPRGFVIMTLDKDLKIVADQYFEGGKYMPNNVFVGKDGLYISTSHPNNPELREDRMVFERFELVEK